MPGTYQTITGQPLATAHAAAGDIDAFRTVTDQCRVLLDHRRDDDPPSLYYFTAEQVAAESGHAWVELAAANPAQARQLLAEATDLLTPLTDHGANSGYPRSALLHGTHLARVHLLRRDLETTVGTLLHLAGRVPDVQSIRCRNLLSRIRRQAGSRVQSGACADALSGLSFLRSFAGDWPEPIPGSEHGDVEYELTRTAWEQRQ